ncbi:MAG: DegT/DnrJ/EryC1/StrS family aminotransferase [Candidatus Micrarchaeota archaeon]
MQIPFVDLYRENRICQKRVLNSITELIQNGTFILGKDVETFEKKFSDYIGAKYCVGVNSGTDALYLALLANNIGPGDEVITTANTYIATALSIKYTGAKTVFVDIKPGQYNINPEKIQEKITPKTKAILPIHLFGHPANLKEIKRVADENDLALIEDCCQAHGATANNRKVGTFGDAGCFSFYPSKNLGAFGDGGALVTNNQNIYKKALAMRSYGQVAKNKHDLFGVNSRLDSIQALVLLEKLKYLDENNKKRRILAKRYKNGLTSKEFILPKEEKNCKSVYHLFVIRTKKRAQLIKYLTSKKIGFGIHYPIPIHHQKIFSEYCGQKLPITEKYSNEIISLPFFPHMLEEEISRVIEKLNEFG